MKVYCKPEGNEKMNIQISLAYPRESNKGIYKFPIKVNEIF